MSPISTDSHGAADAITAPSPEKNQKPAAAEFAGYDEHSGLHRYLQDIGKTPLLTTDEEIRLAERIRRGDPAARDHMIRANLRLVVKIAKSYQHLGLSLPDLISEGNLGLIKAVERFDPHKGAKLSTYAAWWIKQSIKHALASYGRTIRLPTHALDRIAAMNRATMELAARLGREPTDEELAAELQVPARRVTHLKLVSARQASLDAQICEDDDAPTLGEIVRDENATSPVEHLRRRSLLRDLQAMIATLDPREAAIIRLRFGLDGGDAPTLEAVGRNFNVTRERIRQLERHALFKLRRTMARHEAIRSRVEIELDEQQRQRMAVIREFVQSKVAKRRPLRSAA